MNKRLEGRDFIMDDYTIADMACYPWVVPHERQKQDINAFPNLKRWFDAIASRPATVRAYEKGKEISEAAVVTDESRKILFGQTSKPAR